MDRLDLATLEPSQNGQKRGAKPRSASKPAGTPPERKPRSLSRQDRLTIIVAASAAASTVITSMVLNVWAFTRACGSSLGVAAGVMVPLWVLSLTYCGQRAHRSPYLAGSCYALAGFLLVVSLHHLADGYSTIVPVWEGWALAVVTDLLQVASKIVIIRIVRGR